MVPVARAWLLGAACLAGCGGPAAPPPPVASRPTPAAVAPAGGWFEDATERSGLTFQHRNGAAGRYYYPEILGPGAALLDFDNDGDLDAFLVQGGALGAPAATDLWMPDAPPAAGGRLYRNDLDAATSPRWPRFVDVTAASGLRVDGYGLGVAAGDIDNDGWTDLYVTRFGTAQLWRNTGRGTFEDISAESGTDNAPGFGVSAAFVDYDRDGWLDLYVGNNVDYRIEQEKACPGPSGARDYCPPQIYGGTPDRLFRNRGHGRFADVTATALKGGRFGPALGVIATDANLDGWPDIYVANDGEPNLLWMNQRDGTFLERALPAGAALTAEGRAESSMGVDAADIDDDGDDDLVITELTGEGTNVFRNDRGQFSDVSAASGIGPASLRYTGWGTRWVDVDNDGWLDTLAVNGAIISTRPRQGAEFPYGQRPLLLRNLGTGRFAPAEQAGAPFLREEAGRGAAFGDVDNDGDIDVLVANASGPARLWLNAVGSSSHWLGLRLVGTAGRRDMLGARVGITRADGRTLWRRAHSDGSYASASDPRVLAGLGGEARPVSVEVHWPDGRRERWSGLSVDRWHTLEQGQAR